MDKKECFCECHTWGKSCAGYGPGDKNCCSQPHVMREEWKSRIDPTKKAELMTLFREQAKTVLSERAIMDWISKMEIPDHIKQVLDYEINMIGLHCANFEDIEEFDVHDNKEWVLDVLQQFL